MPENQVRSVQCSICNRSTSHDIEGEYVRTESWAEGDFVEWHSYRVVRCRGCGNTAFEYLYEFSEDVDDDGNLAQRRKLFSPHASGRAPVEYSKHFPPRVLRTYTETVDAVNRGSLLLAALGLRTLVESVCIEAGCTQPNLVHKIDELVTKGILAKQQADFLHLHRALGNEAAHEIEAPPLKELEAALDIIESLLQTTYQLPVLAESIKSSRENRGRK